MRLAIALVLVACSPPATIVAPSAINAPAPPPADVTAPPAELVASWHLSPTYTKYLDAGGMPILASKNVDDFALREARYLALEMIGHRPEILRAIAARHIRYVVMAPTEMTTDVPEHSDLVPKDYWDRRARGLGATDERPAVSGGEENLLNLAGDPYGTESIFVHEFSHVVHEIGMAAVDPTFDARLRAAYAHAMATKLWAGTYAATNVSEYFAEGAQSYFDTNRTNDNEHGAIGTRDQVVAYDPDLAKLLVEVYGDRAWRYRRIDARDAADRAHLATFHATRSFAWPARPVAPIAEPAGAEPLPIEPVALRATPAAKTAATTIVFHNARATNVEIEWLDFGGKRVHYLTLRPNVTEAQSTFAGHVWILRDGDTDLGIVVGRDVPGRVEIR